MNSVKQKWGKKSKMDIIIAVKAGVVNIVTVIKRKFNTESNHRMVASESSLSLKLRVRNPPHRIEESIHGIFG